MKDLLIIDLEATCYERGSEPVNFEPEVIEIGIIKLDTLTFNIKHYNDLFFVKPIKFPILSNFCKQLTTITQEDVDKGCTFYEAMMTLNNIYDPKTMVFASWGYYDKIQLEKQCKQAKIKYPFKGHISLKHHHGDFYDLHKPIGMDGALQKHGIKLEGTHHRGSDDAGNIARVATQMIQDGWTHHLLP